MLLPWVEFKGLRLAMLHTEMRFLTIPGMLHGLPQCYMTVATLPRKCSPSDMFAAMGQAYLVYYSISYASMNVSA